MVLLEALYLLRKEYHLSLWVAHYDHRLRKSSLAEAFMVYKEARKRRLPFIYGVSLVREYAHREKISLEMAGRELRYRFFERLYKALDLQKVALAHHADDLAEEVLLKFLRGAGRRGLAGIPIKREAYVVRPLLLVSKEEIEAFARQRGLVWTEDETNRDPRFLRNRVRHLLIPFLEKHFHARVKENLKRTALLLAEEEELIEGWAQEVLEKALVRTPYLALRVPILREAPGALRRRVFWLALKEAGVSLFRLRHAHLQALDQLVAGKARGPVPLPGPFQAVRGPGFIRLIPKRERPPSFYLEIKALGRYTLPDGRRVLLEKGVKCPPPGVKLKWEKVCFPIVIRNRQPGDRIFCPGVGHKKLKKFLWEQGLAVEERETLPLIEMEGLVVAIPGLYIHPEFEASPEEEGLCLRILPSPG